MLLCQDEAHVGKSLGRFVWLYYLDVDIDWSYRKHYLTVLRIEKTVYHGNYYTTVSITAGLEQETIKC